MPDQPTQRSGAEVANAPAEGISEWLHAGELADLMAGNDPGVPEPIVPAAARQSCSRGCARSPTSG